MATTDGGQSSTRKPCHRCKKHEAALQVRNDAVCRDCYRRYIATKTIKRLEAVGKACISRSRVSGRPARRKYVAGLSLGPSSSALIQIADDSVTGLLARKRDQPFDLHVVHVDAAGFDCGDSAETSSDVLLDRWRTRFPRFTFERVPLTAVLNLDTVDWSALPLPNPSPTDPNEDEQHQCERLQALLELLPSPTARADILRLFVRHVLISYAVAASADALLLGSGTTSLAELALAETAKGRGFALPWLVNDGLMPVVRYPRLDRDGNGTTAIDVVEAEKRTKKDIQQAEDPRAIEVYVSHTLRDLLRAELIAYGTLTEPPLTDLILSAKSGEAAGPSAVVSHRGISIEEVMARYFAGVEISYPSVVTNVVRTTAKLERLGDDKGHAGVENSEVAGAQRCGVCSMPLDEQGDDRWRGELGEPRVQEAGDPGVNVSTPRICYGCERSVHG